MKLEEIVKTYGMNDYYDFATGNTYKLSEAIDIGNGKLKIPVESWDGNFLGYAEISK